MALSSPSLAGQAVKLAPPPRRSWSPLVSATPRHDIQRVVLTKVTYNSPKRVAILLSRS
ncbi:unnamed protein product [Spirodela intermedia]|uniref:Uncharacterized protein n=1 Tax=Spirodela intermedia TaxID=51605 RepID=A0A7I8J595_SPIIN|nr:unnamed protein product [Spirodela intermedia]CAA6665406.1 unnamed protein product [Spirodela intermedia]